MAKRHNKKRNTAFLYEVLIRELTKSIVRKDNNRKLAIVSILKEGFGKGTALYRELQLYKDVVSTNGLEPEYAEKFINYLKMEHEKLDKETLFKEQGTIISKITRCYRSLYFLTLFPIIRIWLQFHNCLMMTCL